MDRRRCAWPRTELDVASHDAEWGVPVHGDRTLFEFLVLEGAQAGLSWPAGRGGLLRPAPVGVRRRCAGRNRRRGRTDVPARTPASDALSADLKRRGFIFVGSTICYAYVQAVGLVNDHAVTCFRHAELGGAG
jgi:DNA-3-methyladenine glycosylase I